MQNVRVKTVIPIVLAVLVGIGLVMSLSYQRAEESLSAQLESNYSVVAEKYANELTAWINNNATIIETMAAEIATTGIYESDYKTFHQYLAESLDRLNANGYIYDIYFTYPDNRMACASSFVPDGSVDYVHDRDWFSTAAQTGSLFYSTPYMDSDTGKPVFTISMGVYKDNKLQGVLAADIFVDVLVDVISKADVPQGGYAFLVDQNLGMIAHPSEAYDFDDRPRGVMDVPDAPYAEVVKKIRSSSDETVYLQDYDGVERGIVVAKMPNTGWSVGIATNKAELLEDASTLMRGYLLVGGIIAVIGGALAILLAYAFDRLRRQRREYDERVKSLEKQLSGRMPEDKGPSDSNVPLDTDADAVAEPLEQAEPRRWDLLVPILIIFFLMICMVLYTSRVISDVSVANIHEVGDDRISAEAAQLSNYLDMTKSTLWVTADTVDHMVRNGATAPEILKYITEESENQKQHFDENYTGIYGYVMGEYLDGAGWTPSQNYDPQLRDWYVDAIEANGEAVIVSPYVDAQTGAVIISVCRMLSNGTDALSLDVMMDHILEIVNDLQIKGKGYGFIVDEDGMLIAHQDESKRGTLLTDDEEQLALFDKIVEVKNGDFEISVDGQMSNVFVRQVLDQWYMVIVVSNSELTSEVQQQLIFNVLICSVISILIAFFYFIGRRRERRYAHRIEEMRVDEQRRAYEAKALMLEKEAADHANKAKSDFLADMSHEIRTPINAVLGMNEMILRESGQVLNGPEPDAEASRAAFGNISAYARNIERAGRNLLAIINDILDFSKIEAGKIDIAEEEYQLSSVLNDISNMVFFKTKEKGLEFAIDVDETLPDGLYGDELHLRQVLTNILNNAVKYTDAGCVRLIVRHAVDDTLELGQTLTLTIIVQDTGIGIKNEDREKLFAKFQRVDLGTNSTVEGTGLGLAITRSLLTMMGGSIDVESVYGEGSTFIIALPQRIATCESVGNIQAKFEERMLSAEVYCESFHAPDSRILVVDDTPINLTVAVGLLKNTQMKIDTATSGEEALTLAQDTPYDLVLLDQRMPKMDGIETLRRLRSQDGGANRETPIICLTADAVIGAKERYLAEGFTDYLTKPIDSQALERMLEKYLPAEKVLPMPDDARSASGTSAAPAANDADVSLRLAGIATDVGLQNCQGDEELYRTLLREFEQSAPSRVSEIGRCFDELDWENYGIQVHALKSSSKLIGADGLSKVAARLEAAADAGRVQDIVAEHDAMLGLYASAVGAIRAMMQELGEPAAESPAADEDEILEFIPDDDVILEFMPEDGEEPR